MIWWLLIALLVLAVAALVVARRPNAGRPARFRPAGVRPLGKGKTTASRPAAKPAAPKKAVTPATGPQPGEIWWADVPYEDGSGHKVRPCVVLRGDGAHREVLKITSQDQSDRHDHVAIPTRAWDPGADHDSWLDLTGPIRVPLVKFEDRAGTLDTAIWRKVRRLHSV